MVRIEVQQSAAPLTVLSLFSGIGGFDLGFQAAGLTTIQFCEIDPYCRDILGRHWPGVPIHGDIKTLKVPHVDVVCGGPPCQPASLAGERRGESDNRWLWPEFLECCRRAKPPWIVAENPIGIASIEPRGLRWITGQMEAMGYEVQCFRLNGTDVGAPHRRSRIFIVAYADSRGRKAPCTGNPSRQKKPWIAYGNVLDRRGRRLPTPGFLGLADGVPNWVDRTSTIGNAIIPQFAEIIGRAIIEVNNLTV